MSYEYIKTKLWFDVSIYMFLQKVILLRNKKEVGPVFVERQK